MPAPSDQPAADADLGQDCELHEQGDDKEEVDEEEEEGMAPKMTVGMSAFDRAIKKNTRKSVGTALPRRRCCGLLAPVVPTFEPTLVVLRHSERQDYADSTYKTSPEGLEWPLDAPLTVPRGTDLAAEVAQELALLHETALFAVVATSPYRRCMETAAAVARALGLPVTIDQELGEVRDREMPKDHVAHRSPKELEDMAERLGIRVLNPRLDNENTGLEGIKVFGKMPKWPESLDDARERYQIRIENYIQQSQQHQRNFILVTHADAVAAVLALFQRGCSDVQSMDFCARVVAQRRKTRGKAKYEQGTYSQQWTVTHKAMGVEVFENERMAKYYEKLHLENCDQLQDKAKERAMRNTISDEQMGKALSTASLSTASLTKNPHLPGQVPSPRKLP